VRGLCGPPTKKKPPSFKTPKEAPCSRSVADQKGAKGGWGRGGGVHQKKKKKGALTGAHLGGGRDGRGRRNSGWGFQNKGVSGKSKPDNLSSQ